ncbi:MAG: hypothetical protein ABRQ38_20755 [Candidatus Eremiobacterota bacterium]
MSYSDVLALSLAPEPGSEVVRNNPGPPLVEQTIHLPPGVYVTKKLSTITGEALPDDLQKISITSNNASNTSSSSSETLPDDMKGILTENTGALNGSTGGISSSNTANLANTDLGNVGVADSASSENTLSGKVLWFTLFLLLILLVITVLYFISNRKNMKSSLQENLILK